jgi:hypothetical protein
MILIKQDLKGVKFIPFGQSMMMSLCINVLFGAEILAEYQDRLGKLRKQLLIGIILLSEIRLDPTYLDGFDLLL